MPPYTEPMGQLGFGDVRRRLFERYRAGDYTGAMDIARSAADSFPEHQDRTSYWIACLHALTGDPDRALDTLTGGLQRGLWWAPEMLATDPDLAPLRDDGRLEAVIAASDAARRAWHGQMPTEPVVRDLDADPLRAVVILLHGRGEEAGGIIAQWPRLDGVAVVAPRSSQPFDMRAGCWDDVVQAEADVARARHAVVERTPADVPLVLGGFSQGAALALVLAARGQPIGPVGVVAVAPSARWALDHWDSARSDLTSLRCALIVGDRDPMTESAANLAGRLREAGAEVRHDVVAGLGHEYPPDLEKRVPAYLDWVLAAPSSRSSR